MDDSAQNAGLYADSDITGRVPMARFATPDDVAQAIAFLADPNAKQLRQWSGAFRRRRLGVGWRLAKVCPWTSLSPHAFLGCLSLRPLRSRATNRKVQQRTAAKVLSNPLIVFRFPS